MKIRKENFFLVFILLIGMYLFEFLNKNVNILFVLNICVCFLIVIKARFSLFSLKSILINYVLISIAYQDNTGNSYGLLGMQLIPLQCYTMYILSIIYNTIMYIFIVNSNILQKESETLKLQISENIGFSTFCGFMGFIFAIIAFPPFEEERFKSLLPGHAWNHVAVIFLLFALPNFKRSNLVKIFYGITILWFLMNSERVDMIGLIIAVLIYHIVNIKNENRFRRLTFSGKVKYVLCAIIIFVIFTYIGESRSGRNFNIDILMKKVLVSNTAADVGYVYNCSITYTNNYSKLYGKSYMLYINKLLPFTKNSAYDCVLLLKDKYNTAGGILLLCEPYMNFGYIGIIVFAIIEFFILNFILKKKNNYTFFLYIFILSTPFRVAWYGLVYIEKGIVYMIPIIYFLYRLCNKGNNSQSNVN